MGELKIDGITIKKAYNAVWVFAKSKLKVLDKIAWNEPYIVTGFISKITRISIEIDVEIKNNSNELCAYFRTQLVALDLQSGRIRKVSTVGVNEDFKTNNPTLEMSFSKFDEDNLSEIAKIQVKYTNIDFAGHTNNKEYIHFVLDTFSTLELKNNPIEEFDIVYVNQTYENDLLSILKNSDRQGDIILIKKDDSLVAKCKIVRSINQE